MNPQISDDGSLVIFYSGAEDLLPPGIDQNGTWDVYAYNAHTGSMQLVSATAAGTSGNDESFLAGPGTLSPDGRFVVFESQASDLVPEATDTNGSWDVFVRDMASGVTSLVSVNAAGTASANHSSSIGGHALSDDGRFVVFESWADDLTPAGFDTNSVIDVFVRDRALSTTTMLSVTAAGLASTCPSSCPNGGKSYHATISANGRTVVFASGARLLGSSGDSLDLFARDLLTSTTKIVTKGDRSDFSYDIYDQVGDLGGYQVSADGRRVVFNSYSHTLVPNSWIPKAKRICSTFFRAIW